MISSVLCRFYVDSRIGWPNSEILRLIVGIIFWATQSLDSDRSTPTASEEHFMRRISFAFSLILLAGMVSQSDSIAQGIGEMGGAYGASSAATHGMMNSGVSGALTGPMGAATRSINQSTGAAGGTTTNYAASPAAGSDATPAQGKTAAANSKGKKNSKGKSSSHDEDAPPTPAQLAKKAGEDSNKAYAEAQAKLNAGDLPNADRLFRQSLYYRESIWGAKDPAVPKIYEILGDIAHKRSATLEAETCYHKALTNLIKAYGPGDYVMVPVLDKLGNLYLETFKFSDAVNVYQQSYELNNRRLGETNDQTVQSAINLAKSYLGDESYRQAAQLLRQYWKQLDKGPDSNLAQLSTVLELYQTALQKTNQSELLQQVQARSQQVKDSLLAQDKSKEQAPAASSADATPAAAPATAAAPAAVPAVSAPAPATPASTTPAATAPAASTAATSTDKPAVTPAKSGSSESVPAKPSASGDAPKTAKDTHS